MKFLKWICFILVCLDTLSYILNQADNIKNENKASSKIAKFLGLCSGIAARVFVLCGTATCWLLA
jgi:hypothetical protein